MHHVLAALIAVATLLSSPASAGTIFKCKNAQDDLVYQEKPCAEASKSLTSWSVSTPSKASDNDGESSTEPLVLGQSDHGHYFVDGAINDKFINFLIDTGATSVAIPQKIANTAGLICINKELVSTANGNAVVCTTIIKKFKFGNFVFRDVNAVISPTLDKPLLGMTVLKRFRIDQDNGQMRFTKKY